MRDISGRVALVTGGAPGIGFAMAHSLAVAGAKVALGDIDGTALDRAAAELRQAGASVLPLSLDVADPASWDGVAGEVERALGPVQILCNNAGVGPGKRDVAQLSLEDWNWTLGINLTGVFLGATTFVPRLRSEKREGHIVNTASILGLFATPYHSAYVASKFAVVGLSEVMRMELAPDRIGVSVLCPALVQTPLLANSRRLRPSGHAGETANTSKPAGIDPAVLGALVVEAVRANRLYVFSHAEYQPVVEQRMQRILQAMGTTAESGHAEDISFLAAGALAMTT